MKKVVLTGIKKFEVIEADKPKISNPEDVLLKINSVGVCGSDIHYYKEGKIGDQVIEFPFTIGHECSASVIETGTGVNNISPGDLIVVEPAFSCNECQQCLCGRKHTCLNQKFLGCPGQAEGCLSEYMIMPAHNCFPVPENLTKDETALVEPLSIGYYAASFLKNETNIDSVAILGAGPIGLSVLLSLKVIGINNIYVTDKLDYRLSAAMNAGASWTGNASDPEITNQILNANPEGFDAIFECCGKQEALDQSIALLKPGGTLLIVGIPEGNRISFDVNKFRRKEIKVQNIRRQNNCVQPVIDLFAEKKWSPGFMVTHKYPAEKTAEAFDTVANYRDGVIKAIIEF